MNKFYLSCTVQYADPEDGLTMLYNKDLANITLEEAEALYKEFDGIESLGDEFEPKTRQIKYAVAINKFALKGIFTINDNMKNISVCNMVIGNSATTKDKG